MRAVRAVRLPDLVDGHLVGQADQRHLLLPAVAAARPVGLLLVRAGVRAAAVRPAVLEQPLHRGRRHRGHDGGRRHG
ncbi:hypothetical protein ACFSTC_18780 [Nonomuraea ferruginea]